MRKWPLIVVGGFAAYSGLMLLTSSGCKSISFDGQGGRVASITCFETDEGALPAKPTGLALVLLGGLAASFPFLRSSELVLGKQKEKRIPKFDSNSGGYSALSQDALHSEERDFLSGLEIVPGRVDGWYGDPSKRAKLRYFKSGRWTTATADSESAEEKRVAIFELANGRLFDFFKNVKAIDVTEMDANLVKTFGLGLDGKKIPHEVKDGFVFVPAETERVVRDILKDVKAAADSPHPDARSSSNETGLQKPSPSVAVDRIGQLERLKALLDSGVLSPAEFADEKRRILDN